MKEITEKNIYLLIKLLKEQRKTVTNKQRRHNLLIEANAYDKLLTIGIDEMIEYMKTRVK